jgi:hypothetical protein
VARTKWIGSPQPSPAQIKRAVAVATKGRRFERNGDAWYSYSVATGNGQGRFDEAGALAQHHRLIGFAALIRLGYDDDETHDFGWHLWPTDTPLAFVECGVREWTECLSARAEMAPINALIAAVIGRRP